MTSSDILKRFEDLGHKFTIEGGQIKVASALAKLDGRQIEWLKSNKDKVINLLLSRALSKAIERIEAVYSPTLNFEGIADVRRRELDRMELCSLETVAAWEAGWLKLIADVKARPGAQHVG